MKIAEAAPTSSSGDVAWLLRRMANLLYKCDGGVPAMGEYVIPEILGGGKTLMVGNIIADQFQDTGNYPLGSALAVALMVVLMIVLFVLRRSQASAVTV